MLFRSVRSSSPGRRRAILYLRRRGASGYRGVRARPSDAFSVEVWSGDMRLALGTFDTTHEAARAYDAMPWCLRRNRRGMNFPDMPMREWAAELAPPLRLITDEDHRDNRRRERHLSIAEMDKEAMALWRQRFPRDVINKREFYAQRKEERRAERKAAAQFNIDLGAASSWDSDDDRYLDAFIDTSEEDITEPESESEEEDEE